MNYKLENNSKAVLKAVNDQTTKALSVVGLLWLKNVTSEISSGFGKPIVDTGRLRGSMSYIINDETGRNEAVSDNKSTDVLKGTTDYNKLYVGTNVDYAENIENGTSSMRARTFLKNSVMNYTSEYQTAVEQVYSEIT